MHKNRIKELRYCTAEELKKNPKNWRTHPQSQASALSQILDSVGIVDALLAREDEDGQLVLLDGHLRLDTMQSEKLPVLVVDVTEQEGDAVLASFDPLSAMAGTNNDMLIDLLNDIELEGIDGLLNDVADLHKLLPEDDEKEAETETPGAEVWQVLVTCKNEAEQLALLEQLQEEGRECRALIA